MLNQTMKFSGILKNKGGYTSKVNHIIKMLQLSTFFVKVPVLKKQKITLLRSLLRSPHVNKNAQEHFGKFVICRTYRTKNTLTDIQVKKIYQQLKALHSMNNDTNTLLQITRLKQPFRTFF